MTNRTGLIAFLLLSIGISVAGLPLQAWTENHDTQPANQTNQARTTVGNDFAGIHHSEVHLDDIETAWRLWYEELAPQAGLLVRHAFYRDLDMLRQDFNDGKLDVVDTTSLNYLRLKPAIESNMLPELYGVVRDEKKTHRYLLLVRYDSGIADIAHMENATLAMKCYDDTGKIFLDTLLKRHNLPASKQFFTGIQFSETLSQAVLAVFFNRAQACITLESVFKTMNELNPQLGKRLKILARSPEILNTVFFFHKDYPPENKDFVVQQALTLEKTDYGQQFLMLYKIDRIIRLEQSELAQMQKLLNDFEFACLEDAKE